jgi:uncharacterized protein (TIGR02246 family)
MLMSRYSYLFLAFFFLFSCNGEKENIQQINSVLQQQVNAWNEGDLEGYMQGYWKDDRLIFTGGKSLNKGWKNTLDRYKKAYSSKEEMGILSFNNLEIELLSDRSALAIGEWRLIRITDTLQGRFTLVWSKLNEKWCIIADHSS